MNNNTSISTNQERGVGTSVKRFDSSLNHYREIVQLEEDRLYFLSIYTSPEGNLLYYSYDVEAASDSHYILTGWSESMMRWKMNVPGSGKMTFAEVMIAFIRENGGLKLESLARRYCTNQYHYVDYDFDWD